MTKKIAIYLSGSVVKGKKSEEANQALWEDTEINALAKALRPHEVIFLNPSERADDLSDSRSIVGRDLAQVYLSDVIVVDAREKRGLGVGAEMIFAKQHQIPVVSIVPEESHYHRRNFELLGQFLEEFIHPFVATLSDHVAHDYESAAQWIVTHLNSGDTRNSTKDDDYIQSSIRYYVETQLAQDHPMRDLIEQDAHLQDKLDAFVEKVAEPV